MYGLFFKFFGYFGKSCEINNARGGGKRIWRGHVCVDWIPPDSRNEEERFDNIRDEGDQIEKTTKKPKCVPAVFF